MIGTSADELHRIAETLQFMTVELQRIAGALELLTDEFLNRGRPDPDRTPDMTI